MLDGLIPENSEISEKSVFSYTEPLHTHTLIYLCHDMSDSEGDDVNNNCESFLGEDDEEWARMRKQ